MNLYARIDDGTNVVTYQLPLLMVLHKIAAGNRANVHKDWEGTRVLVLDNMDAPTAKPNRLVFKVHIGLSCFDPSLCGGMFTEEFLQYVHLDKEEEFGSASFFNRMREVLIGGRFKEWVSVENIKEAPPTWMKITMQQGGNSYGKLFTIQKNRG